MFYLRHAAPMPRRAPFSDWCAQVERIIAKRYGESVTLDRHSLILHGCYDCGVSPGEIAQDWKAYHG